MEIKTILITGTGGFIGKNLKTHFEGKYNLLTPRSFEVDFVDKRAVKEFFASNNIDFVIHCGSTGGVRGIVDKDTTVEDNLAMVDNILDFKRKDCRVILFGSGAMYDKSRALHKVKETEIGEFVPKDLYGKSKLLIAQKIANREDVLCLNIFACYGYWEKESRFPSYAINKVLQGEDIIINQNAVFDYLFVEDMQRIVEHFVTQKPSCNIINITPIKSISLLEIAKIVNGFSKKPSEIRIANFEMNNEYTGDNSRLLAELGEFEFTPVQEGLKKLYEYKRLRSGNNEHS